MTTNDKLPKEMQEQISAEAQEYSAQINNSMLFRGITEPDIKKFAAIDHAAGATAWAQWKVKHDELFAKTNLSLAIQRQCTTTAQEGHERMIKERNEYQAQAQRMADALEWIRVYGNVGALTIKFIDKALGQFKDGKGKEAENG